MIYPEQFQRAALALPTIAHAFFADITSMTVEPNKIFVTYGGGPSHLLFSRNSEGYINLLFKYTDEPFNMTEWELYKGDGHFTDGYRDVIEAASDYFGTVLYG